MPDKLPDINRPAPPRHTESAADGVDAGSAAALVMATLPRVMDAMRLAMRSQIDGPLSVPQFRGLNFIAHHPGSSVSALASFLGVTLATASAMADRLVKAAYLHANGSLADRRRSELQISAAGKTVLERMRCQTQADLARSLQGRSPQELAALVLGLQVLDAAFAATPRR